MDIIIITIIIICYLADAFIQRDLQLILTKQGWNAGLRAFAQGPNSCADLIVATLRLEPPPFWVLNHQPVICHSHQATDCPAHALKRTSAKHTGPDAHTSKSQGKMRLDEGMLVRICLKSANLQTAFCEWGGSYTAQLTHLFRLLLLFIWSYFYIWSMRPSRLRWVYACSLETDTFCAQTLANCVNFSKFSGIHNQPLFLALYLPDPPLHAYALRTEAHLAMTPRDHTHTAVPAPWASLIHAMHVS